MDVYVSDGALLVIDVVVVACGMWRGEKALVWVRECE